MNCGRSLHFIGVCKAQNCILSEFGTLKTAFYRSLQGSNLHFIGVCGNRTTLQRIFSEQAFNSNGNRSYRLTPDEASDQI